VRFTVEKGVLSTRHIVRRGENVKVQGGVDKWFLQKCSQNQTHSGPVLCERALIFARLKYVKKCVLIFCLYVNKYVA
jgi:hypothetical protein